MAFSNFIPQVWSARLLEHLDKVHVYAGLMNRDYEGDIRAFGDTVHINQIGSITINDYTGADLADPEELDSKQMDLVIDQAKYFNFQIRDIDNVQSNPKLVDAAMQRASYGINDVVDNYLAGLLLAGAAQENVLTAENLTGETAYDYLVDLGVRLNENNVPLSDGYCCIIAGTNAAGSYAEQLVELEAFRLEKNFSDAVKGLHVYGAKVTQSNGLAVLKCKKAAE